MATFIGDSPNPRMVSRKNVLPTDFENVDMGTATHVNRSVLQGHSLSTQASIPSTGVGTEITGLLKQLGFRDTGCGSCGSLARQMDEWGIEGCQHRRDYILTKLREKQSQLGWLEKAKAVLLATTSGIAFKLDPLDPAVGLLNEAIHLAQEKQKLLFPPPKSIRIQGLIKGPSGAAFNASLHRRPSGELLLAYRTGWGGAKIHIAKMTEDLKVLSNKTLSLFHSKSNYGCEDPRLFEHNGSLWCGYIGVRGVNGHLADTHQMLARINDDLTVAEVIYPHYKERLAWEKNWQFFSHEGILFAVYTISPHKVIKIEGNTAVPIYKQVCNPNWSGGALRGGASPVLVGDEYWCWFHGKIEPKYMYSLGVYTFSSSPPFKPLRITPQPLVWANPKTQPQGQYAPVIFPCGAVKDEGRWRVSCGIHDRWTEVLEFNHDEVEKVLVKV